MQGWTRPPKLFLQFFIVYIMASLKLLTWNVHGLRDKVKRSAVFSFLKKKHVDNLVLVEFHVVGQLQLALKSSWIGWAYHSTYTTHYWGGINPHSQICAFWTAEIFFFFTVKELQRSLVDPLGRYVFLYATLFGELILLLAFHVPPPFCSVLLTKEFRFMAHHPTVPQLYSWANSMSP